MPGNDRRTALLGCLKKIRELVAGFFRAFAQYAVPRAYVSKMTVQPRTVSVNCIGPPASLGPSLALPANRIFPAASLIGRAMTKVALWRSP